MFENPNVNLKVLLIDDDLEFIELVQVIWPEEIELRVARDAMDARQAALCWQPSLIIVDPLLENSDSFMLLDELRMALAERRHGVIYLAKGRGSTTQFQLFGNELFGVLQRSADPSRLRHDLSYPLSLLTGYACDQWHRPIEVSALHIGTG
jgi:DNA-binding response OmpR family regulator